MFKSSGRKKDFICASKSKSLRRRERGRSIQIIHSFPFRKALLYSFFIYLPYQIRQYYKKKTWTRKVRLITMNSRNSLKQWLTRRRVKDFFLAADGDNVGPRAQPVALLDKQNFRNIASVEANPTNTQAHLPRQSNQSKSALRLSRLSLCLCTLCLSLLLKITRGISIPSSDHILHILCLIKFPLFSGCSVF